MSTYASNQLQRRKVTKTKTKHNQQQQLQIENAIEQQQQLQQHERLQLRAISDKLEVLRKQQQQQKLLQASPAQQQQHQRSTTSPTSASTTTISKATTTTTPICCNGSIPTTAILNCCRDINCHLNAPLRGNVFNATAAAAAATATQTTTNVENTRERQRSSSYSSLRTSERSISATTTTTTESESNGPIGNGTANKRNTPAKVSTTSTTAATTTNSTCNSPFDATSAQLTVNLNIDLCSWTLFIVAFFTRFYRLSTPAHIVFDELHYGKYITHYMRNTFFFDQHPPLGKQLIAAVVSFSGYDGNFTFSRIGAEYPSNLPIFWMRFVPALCGSLLAPAVYKLLLEARLKRWTALLGGILIIIDNALLTQSRFVLMEAMLLLFCTLGMYWLLKFQRAPVGSLSWLCSGVAAAFFLACAASVKYVGFLSLALAAYIMGRYLWQLLYDARVTNFHLLLHAVARLLLLTVIPFAVYVGVFYLHLQTLHRAGPHDSIMTSAFQASLDGGLASITKGQPLIVVHGSQITLRHTHGRTCWLHSHAAVYPVRYPDKRGSSHQQQVTCYSFKDVNNWWIVKRPEREDLVVDDTPDVIRHGDIIQLVHGITSRALNSHDVAAPMTPQCQEVSCYIDYEIKMAGELLWRVEILNRETEGPIWHAIKSEIRLIHESTGAALRFSGRLLPDWGFNQHEVVADREIVHKDAIWNVEEHRYTKTQDQRERERQLLSAEMIPVKKTKLTFWSKFLELQRKMLWNSKQIQSHMYSSEPLEWPLLDKGIAYWLDNGSNGQIHLLGNVFIWYTSTLSILVYIILGIFYVLRRRRLCYDISPCEWQRFLDIGDYFFVGYLIHYLPYFFVDRTLFLHHYLPAFLFKLLLLCYVLEHIDYLLRRYCGSALWLVRSYRLALILWLCATVFVFIKFLPISYGTRKMSAAEIIALRWKDTWDFILQKNLVLN